MTPETEPGEISGYPIVRSREIWEVKSRKKDIVKIIRNLHLVFPEPGAVLCLDNYLEPEERIIQYIQERQPEQIMDFGKSGSCINITFVDSHVVHAAKCDIMRLHMILNWENLKGLADLMDKYGCNALSVHMHVYEKQTLLMEGYDILSGPLSFHGRIPKDRMQAFCETTSMKFKRTRNPISEYEPE